MNVEIAFVGMTHERPYAGQKPSATYTFAVSNGPKKSRAEVVLADGGCETIEQTGKNAKTAAQLVLKRVLADGCDPFKNSLFLRVPFSHAEYFSRYGSFHASHRIAPC
jgi:hypothetical protein